MKYLNNSKKSFKFSLIVFLAIFTILFGIIVALLLVFPVQIKSDNTQQHKSFISKFIIFSPNSPMKDKLRERKKIKKFARPEIQRRLDKEFDQMSKIYSPIYDLWLDTNVSTNVFNKYSPQDSSFIWPVISDNRAALLKEDTSLFNQTPFVLIPNASHVKIQKGLYMGSGEYIKSSFSFTPQKRYLILKVLPLSPGNIRAYLGQYVWTKTFSQYDINKTAKFIIPIYDNLEQNYRLSNISSSIYILDFKIATLNSTGREPIYYSNSQNFWIPNNNSQQEVNSDPLEYVSNEVISMSNDSTLARGYNVLWLSIDNFDSRYLTKNFAKLMPNLHKVLSVSKIIPEQYDANINLDKYFLLLQTYKKYGYKTAIFTNSNSVNMDDRITRFNNFQNISKNWLTSADAHFKQQNMDETKNAKNLEGLSAIFKSESKETLLGLTANDKESLSQYLSFLPNQSRLLHQFKGENNIIISNNNYSSEALRELNNWISDNLQNRLFISLQLNPAFIGIMPSFQSLMSSFVKKPSLNYRNLKSNSQMHMLDQQIEYILDTLQAQQITHRTIIIVELKNSKNLQNSTVLVAVPGLKPAQPIETKKFLAKDLNMYAMNLVGIPVSSAVNFYDSYLDLETGRRIKLSKYTKADLAVTTKYHLIMYPNSKKCENFVWKAPNESISISYSNYPVYEQKSDNEIKIFPCDFGENILELIWYQKQTGTNTNVRIKNAFAENLHGYFTDFNGKSAQAEFYYGRKLYSEKTFPAYLKYTNSQRNNLFLVEEKEIDQLSTLAIKSFKLMRSDANLSQNTQVSLFMTRVTDYE